jgi:diadenosine tetraphosphate (Ap4A) HIT family hydrolase
MNSPGCPFCVIIGGGAATTISSELAIAFADAFPVSPGHTLIVSRRHAESLSDLTEEEIRALWDLVPRVREHLQAVHAPDAYNIGLNDGKAAGQTIPHVHVHVIPRYNGDTEDPRGGVRWVIPSHAAYWKGTARE